MAAYYNEFDPFAAAWLRELIKRGLIAPGDVDERSIVEVSPDDLRGYTQCHFFAGIGGWSYALRLAGWGDDRPVWTGSCPCQPFSTAGKQRGSEDERHLWPAWFRLISECRPSAVFGEQVAGASGLAWLDHVCADLEGEGYAAASADLPACSVGAPHRRQRLWWVADAERGAAERHGSELASKARGMQGEAHERQWFLSDARHGGPTNSMGDADLAAQERLGEHCRQVLPKQKTERLGCRSSVGNTICNRHKGSEFDLIQGKRWWHEGRAFVRTGSSPWADLIWLPCSDGKARPTQPGLFPLAHGVSGRVGRLRAYGNAIVPQVAAEFVAAYLEAARP